MLLSILPYCLNFLSVPESPEPTLYLTSIATSPIIRSQTSSAPNLKPGLKSLHVSSKILITVYSKYFPNWALSRYQNLKKGKKSNRILGL